MKFKKANLSLSVNAIVILILAITMLGLGLGFIRGMFTKVSGQIEQQISSEPEPSAATSAQTITLSRESVITQPGKTEVLKVNFYNPTNVVWSSVNPIISCTGLTIPAPQVNPRTIKQLQSESFVLLVDVPSEVARKYLCQAKMCATDAGAQDASCAVAGGMQYLKDFTIEIKT